MDADLTTIKKSYYKLSRKHHPDRAGGVQAVFQLISEAYETMADQNALMDYKKKNKIRT